MHGERVHLSWSRFTNRMPVFLNVPLIDLCDPDTLNLGKKYQDYKNFSMT